ncbi:MAG: 1-acyl-sn-glycerol-3-phosphate acyltransferase [Spirochaetes bacterium]|nr:1-acyl-sn-glycerol-3-phosphate acyltransferase [Spirochaetota bacterium]
MKRLLELLVFYVRVTLMAGWVVPSSAASFFVGLVRWKNTSNNRVFSRLYGYLARWFLGLRVEVSGEERLTECQPCIYVANHQSSLDLTTFARVYPRKTVLIGKKELAYIPFIGQLYALFGNIFIDRKSTGSGVMGIDQAVNALTVRGDSIFMFPEGTRNLAGRGLLPFKKGAFYMAIEAQVPIIPVVCSSLNPLINFKKRYARSGRLMIRVLPPIHTRGKSMRHLMEIVDETRNAMLAALSDMDRALAIP